ncbi:peptidase S6 IgA endopeptidase [Actinobacillus equuli]|nr:peptidase S6 IgA endopeptidase [Actinobacillus equuli]
MSVGGNYVGEQGSHLVFDTTLNDDTSRTDKLTIKGNAQGQSTVSVRNFNGQGALTPEGLNSSIFRGNLMQSLI